jgi:hypothetical protein
MLFFSCYLFVISYNRASFTAESAEIAEKIILSECCVLCGLIHRLGQMLLHASCWQLGFFSFAAAQTKPTRLRMSRANY